jgi:hypothetical protein
MVLVPIPVYQNQLIKLVVVSDEPGGLLVEAVTDLKADDATKRHRLDIAPAS